MPAWVDHTTRLPSRQKNGSMKTTVSPFGEKSSVGIGVLNGIGGGWGSGCQGLGWVDCGSGAASPIACKSPASCPRRMAPGDNDTSRPPGYNRRVLHCPECHSLLPNPKARFCPRCGATLALPASPSHPGAIAQPSASPSPAAPHFTAPIRLEKRGTLWSPFFLISVALVLAGGWMAGEGNLRVASSLLIVGIPAMLIAAIRGLVR